LLLITLAGADLQSAPSDPGFSIPLLPFFKTFKHVKTIKISIRWIANPKPGSADCKSALPGFEVWILLSMGLICNYLLHLSEYFVLPVSNW